MKILIYSVLIMSLTSISMAQKMSSSIRQASATKASTGGVINGGGGNAVLCYVNEKTRNQVFKAVTSNRSPFDPVDLQLNQLQKGFRPQLLDLWDARKPVGFPGSEVTPVLDSKTPEQIYSELLPIVENLGRLALGDGQSVKVFLEENRTQPSQWKAEENGVIRIEDANIQSFFPANCLVAQVAFYDDNTNIVHYDARILRLMEKMDQNALRVHEDFYRAVRVRRGHFERELVRMPRDTMNYVVLRDAFNRMTNSDLTRQLVANLFSTQTVGRETSKKIHAILY